jgi:hypothetical protein
MQQAQRPACTLTFEIAEAIAAIFRSLTILFLVLLRSLELAIPHLTKCRFARME